MSAFESSRKRIFLACLDTGEGRISSCWWHQGDSHLSSYEFPIFYVEDTLARAVEFPILYPLMARMPYERGSTVSVRLPLATE